MECYIEYQTKIAFHKTKGNQIDIAIRIWTNSPYSHCEIVVNKDWYSSSPRDGGVRVKQIQDDGNSWDFIEVDVDREWLYQVYREHKGKGYNFKGIFFSNFLGLSFHNKDKMTCSEFVAKMLGLENPQKYSPGNLYEKLNKSIDKR
jgi:hypothetical protein